MDYFSCNLPMVVMKAVRTLGKSFVPSTTSKTKDLKLRRIIIAKIRKMAQMINKVVRKPIISGKGADSGGST